MSHTVVPEAEKLLDREFTVLDKGFVRLVDYMGSDDRIVQSARVSYGKGTKTVREDKALIAYLLRNQHTSPFEQVILTFHIKLPIFVARQWVRHRTARMNELSARYSEMKEEFFVPELGNVRYQDSVNRQGSAAADVPEDIQKAVIETLKAGQNASFTAYQEMLNEGIARELARINLPVSAYTEFYWQIDLSNLFHFLQLRLHPHAQKEIRDYAQILADIAKAVAPAAYDAFEEHMLHAVRFSASEMQAIKALLKGEPNPLEGRALELFEQKMQASC